MQDMKKYLNSDISCFVNAMLVVLILLASSCSSNWKYEYLKTKEPHSLDAFAGNAQTESNNEINISDLAATEEKEEEEDTTYKADDLENMRLEVNAEGELIGEHKDGIKLDAVFVRETKTVITPVDTSGRLLMSLTVEVPKDIMSSNWQLRLHPRIFIRQNKIETFNFPIEDLYITGSVYRDKQIKGYERYSNYLSKITSDAKVYNNSLNLNKVLHTDVSNYVNKYQLEYFIMRNFPEIYSFKDDTSYISDEKFTAVLGVEKDKVIRHYYNEALKEKIAKLSLDKKKNYREWVYNPITQDSVQTDNVVLRDTLDRFDRIFGDVREKILEDDTLKSLYFKYLDTVKIDKKVDFPALMSDYFKQIDSANLAALVNGGEKKQTKKAEIKKEEKKDKAKDKEEKKEKKSKEEKQKEKELKKDNPKSGENKFKMPEMKLPSLSVEKFKLDKYEVISGNDTSKIYMQFDYSTMLNAFQYPNIDRVYIGITGDVYDDTTHIYKFSMDERLEYPVTSTANLADTTEIFYDYEMVLRKANHGANYSIEFAKNSAALNPNFGNNDKVINDIKTNLEALMKNAEFDLDSIIVSATASPEGAITVNQRFSGQRSDAVSSYFKNYVDTRRWKYKYREDSLRQAFNEEIAGFQSSYEAGFLSKEDLDYFVDSFKQVLSAAIKPPEIDFKVNPIAENWDDLYTLVSLDSVMTDKEKNLFYDTYEKINNLDIRENTMKKHSYYNYMSKELYPQIRVVKFDFHMHRKGMEHDTTWIPVPSEKYKEGVRALRGFDFVKAENILKNYPSYNAAICFIVRKKPIQAINLLEDPILKIDFEHYKAKRDSLTLLYVSLDSTMAPKKDSVYTQMMEAKEKMDRAAKIEFLKAKAYVMRRKGEDDWNKALDSYLFILRMDKLNGLYNIALTGEEDIRGAVFGSSKYFEYTAQTDEYVQYLPSITTSKGSFAEIRDKYLEEITFQLKKEEVKYYSPEKLAEYNEIRQAYLDMGYTPDIVDKIIFLEIVPPEIEY